LTLRKTIGQNLSIPNHRLPVIEDLFWPNSNLHQTHRFNHRLLASSDRELQTLHKYHQSNHLWFVKYFDEIQHLENFDDNLGESGISISFKFQLPKLNLGHRFVQPFKTTKPYVFLNLS
jgi:hypothetical protein